MIGTIGIILSFVVAVVGMVRYKRLTMPFKLLSLSLLFTLFTGIINSYIIARYNTNAALSHIEIIVEYAFYAFIYYYLFKNKYVKKFILASIIFITVFFIINALFLQPYYHKIFPTHVILTTEILYVIFALLLFKQMLLYPVQINIIKQSIFWYNTAILFYSTTMFLNLGLMNYYGQHHSKSLIIVYYFWYSINIVFSLLLGIAILTDKKEVITANAK